MEDFMAWKTSLELEAEKTRLDIFLKVINPRFSQPVVLPPKSRYSLGRGK